MDTTFFSLLTGLKLRTENYKYDDKLNKVIEKKIETFDNNGKSQINPNFIYLIKYFYANKNERIEKNYTLNNKNEYLLRDTKQIISDSLENPISEKFISQKENFEIKYIYDNQNNLISEVIKENPYYKK